MLGRKFRKHAIRNQWPRPRGKFLRRRNHELFNSEVHQRMSTWLLRWQWNDCAAHWMNQWLKDSANQWISGPMNQQVKKSMNQRITEVMNQRSNDWTTQWISETGEPTNQWLNGLATQWIKEFVSQRFRMNQLLNDSDDSVSQWTNEPMTQWVIEPRKPWVNESMIPRFTEPMNDQCFINGSMNQWINKILNRWSSELLNHWIKESVNQWFNDFKSQWLNDSVNKRIKESIMLPTSSSKSAPIPPSFFAILKCKSSSVWHANRALATVSCAFCQRHLPKVLRSFFFPILKCKSSSRCSRTFCRSHLPKVLRKPRFCNTLKCKSGSRYSLVHILSTTSPDRTPQPWKQRPYGPQPHYPKTQRVSHPRVFSPVNSHPELLLHFPTTWWLTWRCGGQDGVNANHDHRPWRESFPSNLPLMIYIYTQFEVDRYIQWENGCCARAFGFSKGHCSSAEAGSVEPYRYTGSG